MKERIIITIGGGEMEAFVRVLRAATDYCKDQGYDALVRGGEHGYEIYVPAIEETESELQDPAVKERIQSAIAKRLEQ